MSKKEKTTLMPKLRFPEFESNGAIVFKNGNLIFEPISNKNHNSDLPVLAITQEYGAIPRDHIDYNVSVTDKSLESYKVVEIGDFIISLRSFQGGIEYSLFHGICSPAYIILRKKIDIVDQYYKHYFKTNRFIQDLNKDLEGIRDGKMVSYNQFSAILLPKPDKKEQQKIADCLSSIDNLISAENEKLLLLKNHKKGLMQKLFPAMGETVPEWRFPEFRNSDEWEVKTLEEAVETITDYVAAGSFADLKSKVNYKTSPDFAQLVRTVDIKNNFKNKDFVYVNSEAFKFLWRVDLNLDAIIMPNIGANIGEVYYLKSRLLPYKNNVLGPNALLLRCNKNNNTFMFNLLLSDKFQKLLKSIVAASGQPKFNKTELKKITICIPTLLEQQKIADCLSALDDILTTQSQKIEVLKLHKIALIQGLFPSAQEVVE